MGAEGAGRTQGGGAADLSADELVAALQCKVAQMQGGGQEATVLGTLLGILDQARAELLARGGQVGGGGLPAAPIAPASTPAAVVEVEHEGPAELGGGRRADATDGNFEKAPGAQHSSRSGPYT